MVTKLECLGNESLITDCKIGIGSTCNSVSDQVVGVRCLLGPRNQHSLCTEDEYLFGNSCFKIFPQNLNMTHKQASSVCESEGYDLLHISSQVENDFVSELLLKLAPSVTQVHTDGIGKKGENKDSFIWENSQENIQFTKWWPGIG